MDTQAIRQAWLESELKEVPVKVSIPALAGANLIIRELSGDEGSALMDACTDLETKKVDQKKLVAGIIIATLRNADDPEKALIWGEFDRDPLMAKGLEPIMTIAQKSIALSGLTDAAVADAKKNSPGATNGSQIVEGSLTTLPTS